MRKNMQPICQREFLKDACLCMALFMLIYGYEILRLGLGLNEIEDLSESFSAVYVAQGRFPIVIYRYICGASQMAPWAYGIAFAIFYSLAVALQIHILELETRLLRFTYIAVSLGIAYTANMLCYANAADIMGLGILLSTVGTYYFQKYFTIGGLRNCIYGFVLLCFGVCCYQINVLLFAILAVACIVKAQLSSMKALRHLVRVGVIAVFACASSLILSKASIALMLHIHPEYEHFVDYAHNYQHHLIGWFFSSITHNIFFIANAYREILLCGNSMGWFYSSCIIPVVYLFVKNRKSPMSLLTIIMIYLLPTAAVPVFASGIVFAIPRMVAHASVSAAVLWCLAIACSGLSDRIFMQRVVFSVALIIIIRASYIASDLAYNGKRLYEFGVEKTYQIADAVNSYIQADENSSELEHMPIVVVGGFTFNGGKYVREGTLFRHGYMFMHTSNPQLFSSALSELPVEIQNEIERMPSFPSYGAIKRIGGTIYVKCPNPDVVW